MKRLFPIATALIAICGGGAAHAADLPNVKGPPSFTPPPPPAFTWTGFYVGANGGYGWGSNAASLSPSPDPTSQAYWDPAFGAGAAPSSFSYTTHGALAGGQAGYNYQYRSFVFGLEADFDWTDISGSQSINTSGVPGFVPGFFNSGQTLDWLGTVRGRIGFVPADRWLVYATGGLAYGQVGYHLNFAFPATTDFQSISTSPVDVGWTGGGGVEWAIWDNLTIRAEYLFVDLGDRTFTSVPAGRAPNLATTLSETFHNDYNIVRAGIEYKFDPFPPPGSVVAKY